MFLKFLKYSLLASLGLTTPGIAQDGFFSTIDVDIDGDSSIVSDTSLIGWITEKISYGLEDPPAFFSRSERELTRVETSLFAQLDTSLGRNTNLRLSGKAYHDEVYAINEGTTYSKAEVNEFRNRFEVKDFYIEQQYDNGLYLKFGNQILGWGMAEYLRVTDLVNIEDQFTLGQQDLEDIRLQVPALTVSFPLGNWSIENVLTYKAGKNELAPSGDEFDQLIAFRNQGFLLQRSEPDNLYEYFFRASTHYSRGDIQLVVAEFNDNALSVDSISITDSSSSPPAPLLTLSQNRLRAAGIAANLVSGPWLFFTEVGLHKETVVRPNSATFLDRRDGWQQKDQLLGVLGIEYNGFSNLLLNLEVNNIHTDDYDRNQLAREDQLGVGARFNWTALNERLRVIGVWNQLADNAGYASRLTMDYTWSDNLNIGVLWVDYHGQEDSIVYDFRNNDVIQLQLRYSFQY